MTLKLFPILRDGWLTNADMFGDLSIAHLHAHSLFKPHAGWGHWRPDNSICSTVVIVEPAALP